MGFFSLDHAEEVHRESQEINDPAWDCTLIKTMKQHGDTTVNAIYEWTDADVWDFINSRGIEVNPLYTMGYRRVGCVMCPLAGHSEKIKMCHDFPQYKKNFISVFDMMIRQNEIKRENKWKDGAECFDWWIEGENRDVCGQISLFDEMDETYESPGR